MTTSPSAQRCDGMEAEKYLRLLDPSAGARFHFQTFCDRGERGDLARALSGTFDEHFSALCRLNEQGAGVFVMVNDGTSRHNAGVTRVRSYFVDLDGAPVEPLRDAKPEPDMLVESSPGKYHGYWLTGGCPKSEFKSRQQALATRFGGDRSVCDLARVMRLPGFYHRKTNIASQVKLLRSPRAA